jgi:hypothetical protein
MSIQLDDGLRYPLLSEPWVALFNAVNPKLGEPVVSGNVGLRGAPAGAAATSARLSSDRDGFVTVAQLPAGEPVDLIVEWSDVLKLSGLSARDAVALGTALEGEVLNRPTEEMMRFAWTRGGPIVEGPAKVPDFAAFTVLDGLLP